MDIIRVVVSQTELWYWRLVTLQTKSGLFWTDVRYMVISRMGTRLGGGDGHCGCVLWDGT